MSNEVAKCLIPAYKTREQINLTTTISADPLIPDHVLIFRT